MAILQISRITNRKGLTENLPQLSGAEFGWCVDSRRLFIGNGTLEEGAPIIGNTEILTEFSDITVLSSYTYQDIAVGYAAQTGPTPGDPVVRTVQAKLDDQASVRDFGAVGDGVADDTAAINRALYELYCRETNTQIRRSLFFPAGTYRVTDTIVVPTYAKLIGEGQNCTTISLDTDDSLVDYVARYGDSLQQTGVNMGTNGATLPRNIEISSMSFQNTFQDDVFLVEDGLDCWFDSVGFQGAETSEIITDPGFNPAVVDCAGVRIVSTNRTVDNVTLDKCSFINNTYGVQSSAQTTAVTISNSRFDTAYRGVLLNTQPTGVRMVHNQFNNIYAEGVKIDQCGMNITAYNAFYNVGNGIGVGSPLFSCVTFTQNDNASLGDMFERADSDALVQPRIRVINLSSSRGTEIQLGTFTRWSGRTVSISNNAAGQNIITVSTTEFKGFHLDYVMTRNAQTRIGRFTVTDPLTYTDDYTESAVLGVTLSASISGSTIRINASSTNTGFTTEVNYSLTTLI